MFDIRGVIVFEQVDARYPGRGGELGPRVLEQVTLRLPQGGFFFLTGPSGAGKSTLLKLLYGELLPSAGRISVFGEQISTHSGQDSRLWGFRRALLRRQIGIVFQDFQLIDHLTVRQNIALPALVAERARPSLAAEITDLLTWLGLGDKAEHLPTTLSGGQQQRVALARAIITRPKLLIADEPTGNLDDGIGHRLVYLMEELNRLGTTTIVATHNSSLTTRFRHPVLQLEGGCLFDSSAGGS